MRSSQLPRLKLKDESVREGKQQEVSGSEGQEVIVQVKLEYHSQKAAQGELITDAELAKWWLASHIHQKSSVWVSCFSKAFNDYRYT